MNSITNLIIRAKTFFIQRIMVSAQYLYFEYNVTSADTQMISLDTFEQFLRHQFRLWEVREIFLTKILDETSVRRISIKVYVSLGRAAKFKPTLVNFQNLEAEWSPLQRNYLKTEDRKRDLYFNYIYSLYIDQCFLLDKNY